MLLMIVFMQGCGDSTRPAVGKVSGTVTLDGQPLPNATVQFQPETGRPSAGITDAAGKYSLSYSPGVEGAAIGHHKVIIRTEVPGADGEPPRQKELLPAKYHNESELTADVVAGDHVQDFNLNSK